MIAIAFLFVRMVCDCFKSRRRLDAELLVLRHQLNVLRQRAPCRLKLRWADRALFVWLYRRFPRILDAIIIVRPETVVRWHRMGFAAYWRWKSRPLILTFWRAASPKNWVQCGNRQSLSKTSPGLLGPSAPPTVHLTVTR